MAPLMALEDEMQMERSVRWLTPQMAMTAVAVFMAMASAVGPAWAGDVIESDTDCHALKLKAATGLGSGAVRTYDFEGTCNLIELRKSGPKVERRFPAKAHVTWNAQKKELVEDFSTIGTFQYREFPAYPLVTLGGNVHSVYACNDDPIVVTHGVACNGVSHENHTGIPMLSNPYKKLYRPITRGKTTLAEATVLSNGYKSGAVLPGH
jgi:hypothetical protein